MWYTHTYVGVFHDPTWNQMKVDLRDRKDDGQL